jgi:hypothetical protein
MATKKKRAKKVSKGERRSVATGLGARSVIDHQTDLLTAWKKGQNPWLTVATPEKNRPFIRVRANNQWGDPRGRTNMTAGADE